MSMNYVDSTGIYLKMSHIVKLALCYLKRLIPYVEVLVFPSLETHSLFCSHLVLQNKFNMTVI